MSTYTEVILIKDQKGLGGFGQKKKVRFGYARNYLIPKKIALFVNKDKKSVLSLSLILGCCTTT